MNATYVEPGAATRDEHVERDLATEELRLAAVGDASDGPIDFYIRRIETLRDGLPLLEGTYGRI